MPGDPPDPDGHLARVTAAHQPTTTGCTCRWAYTTTHAAHLASLLATVRGNLAFTARGWMP